MDDSASGSPPPEAPRAALPEASIDETAVALRNAVKLGSSLIATWGVALVVRFQLPRHLGPERFGEFNFAESFAAAFCVFLGFGVEIYIRKEIPVRPKHASDFFGALVLLRMLTALVLFAVMSLTLVVTGRTGSTLWLCLVFGLTYALIGHNLSLAGMLQASTHVGALAAVNVAAKLLWGVGLFVCIALDVPLLVLVLPLLIAECLRTIVLSYAARRAVGLRLEVHPAVLKGVLVASIPFFVNSIAVNLVNRIDVTMLEFLSTKEEVGWYSAASNIANLAMLISPVLGWVLMPLFARTFQRSEQEFFALLRRSTEAIFILAVPTTLLIFVGADLWIRLAFGAQYEPAAVSLRFLAPLFAGTYLTMLLATALIILGKSWRLTLISLGGLVLQPLFILACVRLLGGRGPGSTGAGAALGVSLVELVVTTVFLFSVGRQALDKRNVRAILTAVAAAGIVVAAHSMMSALGYWRILLDLVLWAFLVLIVGGVRLEDLRGFVWMLFAERRARRAGRS